MKKLGFIFLLLCTFNIQAQKVERVEPPSWWVGMEHNQIELMVYGENISQHTPSIKNKNIAIKQIKKTQNKNYLFVTIDVSKAQAGTFKIDFKKKGKRNNFSVDYELKERKKDSKNRIGFNSSDVIYLITPDRFANADTSNDSVEGLNEQGIDRKHDYARHGGDIKGITNHVDYIQNMGFTAVWPTPVLTNDMKESSYHGYAMTDFYQVDPRFGSLEDYKELSSELKKSNMKLVMDQVANHIGLEHWWMKDLPTNDWVNFQEEHLAGKFVNTNHRRTTNQDSYASKSDKKLMNEGWFVSSMPDLNQNNPLLATYLIQNSIWWIETLDLGGIRQDTYPYPDKHFMSNWAGEIMKEYPNFSIVGEEWSYNPLLVGYWQDGANNKDGYKSNLKSSMDFPMERAIIEAVNEEEKWDTGLVKMYEGLANDFHYTNPKDILIFVDNHDKSRIFTETKEDIAKTKMAVSYMLMLPRIPQLYYGTEILMEDTAKPGDHGLIRSDFPGGWKNDKVNAFTGKGLSKDQKGMQDFLKTILNYRKTSEAIHSGKTVHFAPDFATYTLFRIKGDEIVTFILNKNEEEYELDLNRFEEIGLKGKKVKNILTNKTFTWKEKLKVKANGVTILTTKL
ncbi:Glycosidase [Lutibacter oricola]|uniref:Glycosidase n=1 Tax=Lutibacter oricola TaxID=762486 RepID=A0A1H3GH37_9FLAO|nr:glycoside hydrolase family 13 protein [Lutibacter oricola]SDY02601.1 Glycosidase [Lutibacter oricola]